MATTNGISGAKRDRTAGQVAPKMDSHEAWTTFRQLHALLARALDYAEGGDQDGAFDMNDLVSLLEIAKGLSGKVVPWVDEISLKG